MNISSTRFRRLVKEGFWIVAGQFLFIVGSLVGIRLLTGLMEPSEYGKLALGITIASLVNQVIMGPLGNGVGRFYAPAKEKQELGGYLKSVRNLVVLANIVVIVLCLISIIFLIVFNKLNLIGFLIAATIFAILSGDNSIINGIQNAARQRSVVAFHQGIEPWTRFLFAAGLMVLITKTSSVAILGYALSVFLILGSQYLFFKKKIVVEARNLRNTQNWTSQIWKFSWPFSSWGIFTWGQLVSDRWALGTFGSMKEVGMYAALYQLGYYPMSLMTGLAMKFLAPILYQRAGDATDQKRNDHVKKISWNLTGLVLAGTIVIFLVTLFFHKFIFQIFVAKEYVQVSKFLPWLLLSGGIFASGQTISLDLMSRMATHTMVRVKIITAVLGIILNFFMAHLFGIKGVVFANLIFSLMYFIWISIISMRVLGKEVNKP